MVIDYFDIYRTGRPARPFEAESPLVVDADTVLALAVALECFEPISRSWIQDTGCLAVTLSITILIGLSPMPFVFRLGSASSSLVGAISVA